MVCSRKFDTLSWRDFTSTTRSRYRVSQTRSSHQPAYLVVSYQWQHLDYPRTPRRVCCLLMTTRWRCMCSARRTRLGEGCMGYNSRMKVGLGFITLISGEGTSHRRWRFNRPSVRLCHISGPGFCSSDGYMFAHLLTSVTTGTVSTGVRPSNNDCSNFPTFDWQWIGASPILAYRYHSCYKSFFSHHSLCLSRNIGRSEACNI